MLTENKRPPIAVVILAAGLGTRMRSHKAKVLHEIDGRPMLAYVIDTAVGTGADTIVAVVGHQAEQVRAAATGVCPQITFAFQAEQNGTGHAVQCALPALDSRIAHVVILSGDVPLLRAETVAQLVDAHLSAQRDLTLLAVDLPDPAGYGRILSDASGRLEGIVEQADATDAQRAIKTINAGIYCVEHQFLAHSLAQIGTDNAQGELYLTDIVAVGHSEGRSMGVVLGSDPIEVAGVNSRSQLAQVAAHIQHR